MHRPPAAGGVSRGRVDPASGMATRGPAARMRPALIDGGSRRREGSDRPRPPVGVPGSRARGPAVGRPCRSAASPLAGADLGLPHPTGSGQSVLSGSWANRATTGWRRQSSRAVTHGRSELGRGWNQRASPVTAGRIGCMYATTITRLPRAATSPPSPLRSCSSMPSISRSRCYPSSFRPAPGQLPSSRPGIAC